MRYSNVSILRKTAMVYNLLVKAGIDIAFYDMRASKWMSIKPINAWSETLITGL